MTEEEKRRACRRLAVCHSLLPTPFEEDGRVDWFSFERLLQEQIQAGALGVGVCFPSGEGGALRDREYGGLISMAAGCLGGKVPLLAGCVALSTDRAVRLARLAFDAGADALYCPPPAGVSSYAPGYFGHLTAISRAVSLPVIAARSPGKSALGLCAEQLQIEGVVGVAEQGEDLLEGQLLRRETPREALLFSARDHRHFSLGCLGYDAALSPLACLYPKELRLLFEGVRKGRLEKARQIQLSLLPLIAMTEGEQGTALIKWALHRRGLCTPTLRLPLATPPWRLLDDFERVCRQFERECGLV